METRNLAAELAGVKPVEMLKRFYAQAARCQQSQTDVLMDILRYAAGTEYGKAHDFAGISTVEEFRAKVPITEFHDYEEAVERLKKGEPDILFPGKASFFAVTSGTTGKSKYIPDSKLGERIKSLVVILRMLKLSIDCPAIFRPGNKVFAISNSASIAVTEGGIPCGAASGQAAGDAAEQFMVLPQALVEASELSLDELNYLTILYAMAEPNVVMLICNNVAHMAMLMDLANQKAEDLIRDIREGTFSVPIDQYAELSETLHKTWKANPDRAAELEKLLREKGEFTAADLWKNFHYVGCWTSGSVGRTVKEYTPTFPEGTVFWDWGYGASEGKLNIPYESGNSYGIPAVFGYFMEFLPLDGGEPVLLHETQEDHDYELLLTSYSGFYRYNIHDVVRVSHTKEGIKTLCFEYKSSDKIEIDGKTLYAGVLTRWIEEYEASRQVLFRVFRGSKEPEGLHLDVEPVQVHFDVEDFTAFLSGKLSAAGIPFAGVTHQPAGFRQSMFARQATDDKSVNRTKLLVF